MNFSRVNLVENRAVSPADVRVENGRVAAIAPAGALRPLPGEEALCCEGLYLSHGFIDIHVHGGGTGDFMDATAEAWHAAAALHLRHGTTALVPTTLAADTKGLLAAFETYRACRGGFADSAKFLGVHVEGPYLSPAQCGAQDPAFLRAPDKAEYAMLLAACPGILRWTVAPELPGALEMGDWLAAHGVAASVGHSNATYEQVREAALHGFRSITHLYSAMSTITREGGYRRAGVVESAYLLPGLFCELIADGRHLPPCLLQMAYRLIGPERLCLVTDAMRAAGQTEGESILGSLADGQRVIIEDGVAKMPDRTAFAGSVCTGDRLVRTMAGAGGAGIADAVHMATAVPARALGLEQVTGHVAVGRAADLVLFDSDVRVRLVLVDGAVRFRAEERKDEK